jgi:hypothetical protein
VLLCAGTAFLDVLRPYLSAIPPDEPIAEDEGQDTIRHFALNNKDLWWCEQVCGGVWCDVM